MHALRKPNKGKLKWMTSKIKVEVGKRNLQAYVITHCLNQIEINDEQQKHIWAEFTTALTDHKLRWLSNQGID
jgi:hypothetical protein